MNGLGEELARRAKHWTRAPDGRRWIEWVRSLPVGGAPAELPAETNVPSLQRNAHAKGFKLMYRRVGNVFRVWRLA